MANEAELDLLKKGVIAWNTWRRRNPEIRSDLSEADLGEANLFGANLFRANLVSADLREANLIRADLSGANLGEANLSGAKLIEAKLSVANLVSADLREANLGEANLSGANLFGANLGRASLARADLHGANLFGANLCGADLHEANLCGANLSNVMMADTGLGDIDLSEVKGLEAVQHLGPSSIGIDTIYRSKGKIPEIFLRGAGVPDDFITHMKSLVGTPIEYYSCFISFSSKDEEFAKRLHADLQSKGVRCWFAPKDMRGGRKIRPQIDEAIRQHEKLLLVLSKNSIESRWVEKEVETAFEEERKQKKLVLFPIRLDDAVMNSDQAWVADLRRQWQISDFCNWKEDDRYQEAFTRLLSDLKAEHKAKAERA